MRLKEHYYGITFKGKEYIISHNNLYEVKDWFDCAFEYIRNNEYLKSL